jgi:DNA (cytosine-5)-methyltransferase 1
MRELSLFSGAGGGLLGSKLLGWECVGYVEFNDYCQRVLAQRIKDGILDEAPIFGDIRHFIQSGAAREYRGFADVVTAGFPCQPFSVAGKSLGEDDERNMWPETITVIRQVRPRWLLLENVPGIIVHTYFGTILRDLSESGFDVRWTVLGYGDIGGVHIGRRLWMVAKANEVDGKTDGQVHARSNNEIHLWGRSSWPSIQDAEKAWMLSNSLIVPKDHGMAGWVDEFEAIGNGQVPIVAKTAWSILSGGI